MGCENYDYLPPGEHTRVAPEPTDDPTTWPGSYVTREPYPDDIPQRIKELHEYWEPTVGVQWYQLPRGTAR